MSRHISLGLGDLRVVVALAEELNFRRAARRAGLTQTGVTRVLIKVERHVGAVLFERSHSKNHSVLLTDAGRHYVEHARLALVHSDSAIRAARDSLNGVIHQIVVGRSLHADPRFVEILRSMELPLYPNLRVFLPSRYGQELEAYVRAGEFDLAMITNPSEDSQLTTTLLYSTPFTVVLPEGHKCASAKVIKLNDLSSTPWILFERQVHPALYDTFQNRARDLGIRQERIHLAADSQEACDLVCRVGAAAFLSPHGAENATKDGVALCTLAEGDLLLATHLVARAENGSMLVSEFTRGYVKRLKHAELYQPELSASILETQAARSSST